MVFGSIMLAVVLGVPTYASAQTSQPNSVDSLIHAIQYRDFPTVKKLLNSGMDLSRVGRDGTTPLESAIIYRLPDIAIEMIRKGAAVNLRPGVLSPPLMVAAEVCSADVVRVLLERGAKVNYKNGEGDTPLIYASMACKDGRIVQMLLKAGADPNASDGVGYTPLIGASESGNVRAVEQLIAAGADLNAKNSEGESALDVARDHPFATEAHVEICVLLLKASSK